MKGEVSKKIEAIKKEFEERYKAMKEYEVVVNYSDNILAIYDENNNEVYTKTLSEDEINDILEYLDENTIENDLADILEELLVEYELDKEYQVYKDYYEKSFGNKKYLNVSIELEHKEDASIENIHIINITRAEKSYSYQSFIVSERVYKELSTE